MAENSIKKRICHASSIEDIQNCLKEYYPRTFKIILLMYMTYIRIFFQNILLSAIRKIAFKSFAEKADIKKIVAYTQGILGDHIVVLPGLAALKKRFPHAELTVITFCGKQIGDLFASVRFIDKVIALDNHPVIRDGLSFRLDTKLDGLTCDLFVNLSPYGNRGWIGAVLREIICARYLRARFAIGFKVSTWRGPHFLRKIQHFFQANEPRRPRQVLQEIGISSFEEEDLLPSNPHIKDTLKKKLIDHFGEIGSLAVIVPGGKFSVQRWPADRFQSVAIWLEKHRNAQVIILGSESERILGEVVAGGTQRALNLTGKTTLLELFEILRLAKICITNDTGTMHAAALMGLPTLAIFGTRMSPYLWFPFGNTTRAIFCLTDCSLCHKNNCTEIECLKLIEDIEVIEELSILTFKWNRVCV